MLSFLALLTTRKNNCEHRFRSACQGFLLSSGDAFIHGRIAQQVFREALRCASFSRTDESL
jgi:hypothetical protein